MEASQENSPEDNGDNMEEEVNDAQEFKEENSPPQKKPYHYDPILPPCRICGTKATGYHFGVITCEACKIFFRRSLGRQKPYRCKGSGNCNVVPDRRLSCSFCRLQKCHRLGMSRDGIQRGRYTVEKKSRCILEVKQLQSQSPGTPIASDSPGSSESSNIETKFTPPGMDVQFNNNIPGFNDINDPSSSISDALSNPQSTETSKTDANQSVNSTMSPKSSANLSASAAVSKLLQTASLEELARVITVADQKTLMVEQEQMEKLKVMRDTADIDSPDNPHDAALTNQTEVDKGKHKFAKCIIGLVTDIKQFIKFAKLLPGFLDLCLEDQILLLREGMLDWVMLSSYEAVDSQSNVSICASCQNVYTMKDFRDIGDPGYYQQSLLAAKVLHKLQFFPEELAVFKALSIYSPDGSEGSLKEPQKVEDLQVRMVDVLCYMIAKKRSITDNSDAAIMLGRFIHSLTETRAHSLRCKQLVDQCLIQLFPDIEYPELLLEMFGDERVNMLQSLRAANSTSENDMTNLTEPVSPPISAAQCDCDPVNKEDFKEESDVAQHRHEQLALYEEQNATVNIGKIANDAVMAQSIASQNKFSSLQPNSSLGRPPKKPTMLQTALLEDASCWEDLWARSSNDASALHITTDVNVTSSNSDMQCTTTGDSNVHEEKHVCIPPDVIKYLFSRGMRPQDMENDLTQNIEDGLKSGGCSSEKLKSKKKHHDCFPILPPCKVCGAKATGFHFGAITCDACQIFFRRSLERQKPYKCKGNGDCNVVPDRRLTCSYCRLQRCHQLGMSRDAIQRGRYTVERKTYCIQEARLATEAVGDDEDESTLDKSFNESIKLSPESGSTPQNDELNGKVSPRHWSGAATSSPVAKNQILNHGEVLFSDRQSPSNRVHGFETNHLLSDSTAVTFQRAAFSPPNDANNNNTFHSMSPVDDDHAKLGSSVEMVSNAFRVMNDFESQESTCPPASSGYHRDTSLHDSPMNSTFMQTRHDGNHTAGYLPFQRQISNDPDGSVTRNHESMSCSPPVNNPVQYVVPYSATTSPTFSNAQVFSTYGDLAHKTNLDATHTIVSSSDNAQTFRCSASYSPLSTSSSMQFFPAAPSNQEVSHSQSVESFRSSFGHVYSSASTSSHAPAMPSTSEWTPMEMMTSQDNILDCSSMSYPSTSNNLSNMHDSIKTSPNYPQFDHPAFPGEPSTMVSSESQDDSTSSTDSLDSIVNTSPSLGEKYDPEIEKLIETVTNAHLATLMVTDENREALFMSQSKHIEYRKLRESVFGRMDPLCPEQYKELYKRTGLDVDNRRTKISQCFLTQVTYVNKLAQFAQKMPGFSDLVLEDQITLLRGSAGDFMLFVNLETFDCEHKIYTCSVCHANYDKEEFFAMGDMEFHDQWATAAQVIQKLELRDPEAALLLALSLFSPDGLVGLPQNQNLIQSMQMRIAEALCYVMRRERDLKRNRDVAVMFGRLVQALTELKHASLLGKRLIDRFIIEMFPDIEYPEVLMEIYGDETKKRLNKLRASHHGYVPEDRKSPL